VQVEFTDGTSQTIGTDGSWKSIEGPITYSGEYGGEDFDARLWPAGWDAAGFDDSAWSSAAVVKGPGGELAGISRGAPPINIVQTFTAAHVTQPKSGVFIYDLGQNAAFLPQITVSGNRGAVVKMAPGELLQRDGTVSQESGGKPMWFSYTLAGSGEETWCSRFTYVGSRYVQVTGAVPKGEPNPSGLPVVEAIAGKFITSDSPAVGEFECSSDLFNRTANLIRWAMRSNMQSVLTDCPHRERLGWLEQDHLVGPSMMYNFDVQSLMDKICWDMSDAQTAEGLVPDIAPEYARFGGGFRDSPEWGSACVLIPWQLYKWYGDLNVLRDHYDMMERYVHYLDTKSKNNILSFGLGDWYDIGPRHLGEAQLTPKALTTTAFYYRDLSLLSQIAGLIARKEDAQHYAALAGEVRDSFNHTFYKPQQHSYATGSQTALSLPLVFDMVPPADRTAVGEQLMAELHEHDDKLTAGDIGYRYLLRALAGIGRSDVIYDMNKRSDRPGYGYILAKGATALTEGWDGSASQDHFMLGHIMEWFYSDLAGIAGDSAFTQIDIHPTPVGDITWAKASYQSVRGPIASSWKIDGPNFTLDVTIPPGAVASVRLPGNRLDQTTESTNSLSTATGVSNVSDTGSAVKCTIASGSYRFKTRYAPTTHP
jgi:alpha-L-rhamnosidase